MRRSPLTISELAKNLDEQRNQIRDEYQNLRYQLKKSIISPQAFTFAFITGWAISRLLFKKTNTLTAKSNKPNRLFIFTRLMGSWLLFKRLPFFPWIKQRLIHYFTSRNG